MGEEEETPRCGCGGCVVVSCQRATRTGGKGEMESKTGIEEIDNETRAFLSLSFNFFVWLVGERSDGNVRSRDLGRFREISVEISSSSISSTDFSSPRCVKFFKIEEGEGKRER